MAGKSGSKPGGADHQISGRFRYQDAKAFAAGAGNQSGILSSPTGNLGQTATPVAFVPIDQNWNMNELEAGATYELTMRRVDDVGT